MTPTTWPWRTPDLIDRVVHRFPEPIADVAARWLAVWHEAAEPGAEQVDATVDAFEKTVQFLTLLAAAEYQRHRAASTVDPAEEALARLCVGDRPISTGIWWDTAKTLVGALRKLANAGHEHRSVALVCPELIDVFSADKEERKRFDDVPRWRNDVRHGLTPDAGRAPRMREELTARAKDLASVWQRLAFLERYDLCLVCAVKPEPDDGAASPKAIVELRTGASRHHPRCVVRLAGARAGEMVLVERHPSGSGQSPQCLCLHPFVVFHAAEDPWSRGPALLDGREKRGDAPKYIAVRAGSRVQIDQRKDLEAIFDVRAGAADPARKHVIFSESNVDVGAVVDAAVETTQTFIAKSQRDGVYLPAAFVERMSVSGHIEEWAKNPELRLLLVTGSAGAGKTSLMCHTAQSFLRRSGRDVVLLVAGSALPANFGHLEAVLARYLKQETRFGEMLDRWHGVDWAKYNHKERKEPGRLLLFVDGIDRSDAPKDLLRSLLALAEPRPRIDKKGLPVQGPLPGIKVMASVALPVVDALGGELLGALQQPWVHPFADGPAGGRAVLLAPLSETELKDAYEEYCRDPDESPQTPFEDIPRQLRGAMRNPLLLRLVWEMYRRKEIKVATDIDVLVEYTRARVFKSPEHQDFVARLVDLLDGDDGRRRHVERRELLDDPCLRNAVLDRNGPYHDLLEAHVLTEIDAGTADDYTAPTPRVEFTFDVALGYLLLAFRRRTVHESIDLVRCFVEAAASFTPAGFALDLALRLIHRNATQRARAIGEVLRRAEPQVATSTLARYLEWIDSAAPTGVGALLDDGPLEGPGEGRDVPMLLDTLIADRRTAAVLLDVAVELRKRGSPLLAAFLADRLRREEFTHLPPGSAITAVTTIVAALRQAGHQLGLERADTLLTDAFEKAKNHKDRIVEKVELMLARAKVAVDRTMFDEGLRHADEALALLGEAGTALPLRAIELSARLHLVRGHVWVLVDSPDGARHAERAAKEARKAAETLLSAQKDRSKERPETAPPKDASVEVSEIEVAISFLEARCAGSIDGMAKAMKGFLDKGLLLHAAWAGVAIAKGVKDPVERLRHAEHAREVASASGFRGAWLAATYREARALKDVGQYEKALKLAEDHERVAHEVCDTFAQQKNLRLRCVTVGDSGNNVFEPVRLARRHVEAVSRAPGRSSAVPDQTAGWTWRGEDAAAHANLADFLRTAGRFGEAIEASRKAEEIASDIPDELSWASPTLSLAWRGLSKGLAGGGDLAEAERAARVCISALSGDAQWDARYLQAWATIGLVALERNSSEVVAEAMDALRAAPDRIGRLAFRVECYAWLAYLQSHRGEISQDEDVDGVIQDAREALKLCGACAIQGPSRWMAAFALYRALSSRFRRHNDRTDLKEALDALDQALRTIAFQRTWKPDDHEWQDFLRNEPIVRAVVETAGGRNKSKGTIDWDKYEAEAVKEEAERKRSELTEGAGA